MTSGLHYSSGAERLLDGIARRLSSRDGVLDAVAEQAQSIGREIFASDGFGTWAPDSLHTIELKGSSRVLVDTGRLLADITGAPGIDEGGEAVVVGTSVPYYGYLKGGARGAPRRNPTPDPGPTRTGKVAEKLLDYVVDGGLL